MADLQGLLNDPRFRALPPERQRALIESLQQRTSQATAAPVAAQEPTPTAEERIRQANPLPVHGEEEVLGTLRNLPAEVAHEVAGYLPAAGGILGGVIGSAGGPVGTAGGAGFGAAAGEAGRRLIDQVALAREAPSTAEEAQRALAGEFATGAALGVIPGAASGVKVLAGKASKPIARGVVQAASDVVERGMPLSTAAIRGAVAAIKPEAKKVLKARIAHAVKRSARLAAEETPRAAAAAKPAVAKAAAGTSDVPVGDILADMQKRVVAMRDLGVDSKDISKSLVKHYESSGRGAGLTAGKMRSLVDEIIKQSPKAETNLADEMAARVLSWTKEGGGKVQLTRAQMDDALRELYPVELTPSKAREVVDLILDTKKIGPKRTAAEMGVSMNQQFRAARAAQAAKGS